MKSTRNNYCSTNTSGRYLLLLAENGAHNTGDVHHSKTSAFPQPRPCIHTQMTSVLYCSTHTVSVQESLDVTSKNPSQKPNFAVKNAESEPYCQSLRGFSPVLRNSFIKIALKIKKSAILLPVFLPIACPSNVMVSSKRQMKNKTPDLLMHWLYVQSWLQLQTCLDSAALVLID